MGIEPKIVSESEPISEVTKIAQPVGTKNVTGTQVNPATEDTLAAQLNITLSVLRDAICAAAPDNKTLNDLYTQIREFYEPKSAYSSSVSAALTVDLDTGLYGGRTYSEIWVKSSAAADFNVYGSKNGSDWRLTDVISLTAAGEQAGGYWNAYRYIRVSTTAANNNEIEIVGSR